MHRIVAVLLITLLCAQSASAATIYLRDKTRIENVKILEEVPGAFHIRKAGENYSIVYSHDTVNKADIFCIMGDSGELLYPSSLTAIARALPGATDTLTANQFQEALLRQQLEGQQEMNRHLSGIKTILGIQLLLAIGGGIAIAVAAK